MCYKMIQLKAYVFRLFLQSYKYIYNFILPCFLFQFSSLLFLFVCDPGEDQKGQKYQEVVAVSRSKRAAKQLCLQVCLPSGVHVHPHVHLCGLGLRPSAIWSCSQGQTI